MGERTDSDEVDLFVGGVDPDPNSLLETSRVIAGYKLRPDYPARVEEAKKILADAGIDPHASGLPNAKSLQDHWHHCLTDLAGNGSHRPHPDHVNEKAKSSE